MLEEARAQLRPKAERYYEEGHWRSDSLWDDFAAAATAFADKTAFIFGDRSLSFAELDRAAAGLAARLAEASVEHGDIVAIFGRNSLEAAVSLLACIRLGAVMAPVPPMFGAAQLSALLDQCGARALLCIGPREFEKGTEARAEGGGWELIGWTPDLLEELLVAPAPTTDPTPLPPDVPNLLLHSSGTTSTPKAIVHSGNTLRYTGEQIRERWELEPDDVYLIACEFGFVGSLLFGYVPAMLSGALSILPERWNPAGVLGLIEAHRVTYMLLMPTHTADILSEARPEDHDLGSMRVLAALGLTPERRRIVEDRFGVPPISDYGLSEVPGNCAHALGEPAAKVAKTEGRPYRGTEVWVVDEDGNPLEAEAEGAIEVDGPSRFLYFLGNPELTAELIAPWGGYRTGDRGYLDADGQLVYRGRSKDTIERGGVQILPSEVEPTLLAHPAVRDVAVVPFPDDRLGERVCAALVLAEDSQAPTVEELQEFLDSRGIAKYLWPEMVEVFDDFPRTSSLKPIKRQITTAVLARHPATAGA